MAEISVGILIMKKVCKKCGVEKPLLDYEKYTAGKGGIRNICRECETTRRRNWKRKNADRINEGRRERTANDPEYREAYRKYKRKYRTIHREIFKTRKKVQNEDIVKILSLEKNLRKKKE